MNNKILQEKEHSCKGAEWILEYNNFLDKVNKRRLNYERNVKSDCIL